MFGTRDRSGSSPIDPTAVHSVTGLATSGLGHASRMTPTRNSFSSWGVPPAPFTHWATATAVDTPESFVTAPGRAPKGFEKVDVIHISGSTVY